MALIIRFSVVGFKNDMYWRTNPTKAAWSDFTYAGIIRPADVSLGLAAASASISSMPGASPYDAADAREFPHRSGSNVIVSNFFRDNRADR
jgi:hypothetical protein